PSLKNFNAWQFRWYRVMCVVKVLIGITWTLSHVCVSRFCSFSDLTGAAERIPLGSNEATLDKVVPTGRNQSEERIIPCGVTKELQLNDWAFIESPNAFKDETKPASCKWRFLFSGCRLAVSCPTFRLNDFFCMDYLEISTSSGLKRKYCGAKGPKNLVTSDETEITYRTSNIFNSLGFRCRVACNGANDAGADTENDFPPVQMAAPINCSCGLSAPPVKIINGEETRVNEFPWMAGLVRKGGSSPFCGASLINSRYILTAAHCVSGRTPSNLDIILNEHNTQVGTETKFPIVRRAVEAIYPHRSYSSRLDYDAAIIKLRADVQEEIEDSILLPVCLPSIEDRKQSYENQLVTVSGWGVESEGGLVSPVLRKTSVKVLTNSACVSSYPGSITSRMLCAAAPSKDACQGDSGGPLVLESNDRYTQIGVVSWGHGCARPNKPGVYSRVTEFLRWIAQVTADGRFCNE
ncbi:unnamed protein product, partial [Allacma fusca]